MLLGFGSCGGANPAAAPPPPNPPETSFKLTTFNTALLPSVAPLISERLPLQIEQLNLEDSDVLCLQEIWDTDDRQTLIDNLSGKFPHMFFSDPERKLSDHAPLCTEDELQPAIDCLKSHCLFSVSTVAACGQQFCSSEIFALAAQNRLCAQATFAQAGKSLLDLLVIENTLTTSTLPTDLFAFEGNDGLLLASKFPFVKTAALDFYNLSTTSRRSALFAIIDQNGKHRQVACTHLTSDLQGKLPYTGDFASWQAEAEEQADAMIQFAPTFFEGGETWLAGDFNCSWENSGTGVASDFESVCEKFTQAGYLDPAQGLPCTFCVDNLLNLLDPSLTLGKDLTIDHVFVGSGASTSFQIERALEGIFPVNGSNVNLSDHYGVKASETP